MKSGKSKKESCPKENTDTHGYSDGRSRWEWCSRYHKVAKKLIRREAIFVTFYLLVFLVLTGIFASLSNNTFTYNFGPETSEQYSFAIKTDVLLTFFIGGLGGTTYSIKWLMHSVATGHWHLDRFYWRIFVPLVGCVYAVIILQFMSDGLLNNVGASSSPPIVLAFLIGYFSDGVSGLLTNIANAIFGTIERK